MQADDKLKQYFDQNQVDQKVAEEMLRAELGALDASLAATKAQIEEDLVDKVRRAGEVLVACAGFNYSPPLQSAYSLN